MPEKCLGTGKPVGADDDGTFGRLGSDDRAELRSLFREMSLAGEGAVGRRRG